MEPIPGMGQEERVNPESGRSLLFLRKKIEGLEKELMALQEDLAQATTDLVAEQDFGGRQDSYMTISHQHKGIQSEIRRKSEAIETLKKAVAILDQE